MTPGEWRARGERWNDDHTDAITHIERLEREIEQTAARERHWIGKYNEACVNIDVLRAELEERKRALPGDKIISYEEWRRYQALVRAFDESAIDYCPGCKTPYCGVHGCA